MALNVMVNNVDGKPVALTEAQFKIAEPILVRMMNGEIKEKQANVEILDALIKANVPLP